MDSEKLLDIDPVRRRASHQFMARRGVRLSSFGRSAGCLCFRAEGKPLNAKERRQFLHACISFGWPRVLSVAPMKPAATARAPRTREAEPPRRQRSAAIGLVAWADSEYFDGELPEMKKDDTAVAYAEAEFGARRLEFDHVADAGRKAHY